MTAKPDPIVEPLGAVPQNSAAFEMAVKGVPEMSFNERVALMKFLSDSMNGPRFFTANEVKTMIAGALDEQARRKADLNQFGALRRPGGM